MWVALIARSRITRINSMFHVHCTKCVWCMTTIKHVEPTIAREVWTKAPPPQICQKIACKSLAQDELEVVNMSNTTTMEELLMQLVQEVKVGPSMGMGNPCGSWVWVPSGCGYGSRKVNPHHNPYPRQWVLTHGGYGCG